MDEPDSWRYRKMRKLSSAEVIAPIGAGRRTRGRRRDGKAPEERGEGRVAKGTKPAKGWMVWV